MRRIQRAIDKEPIVKAMTDGEQPCFKEIFRLLLFAAMLGFKLKRREPLEKVDSGKSIPESYFTNTPVWPGILYLIGIAETGSTTILQVSPEVEDTLASTFEEYANGGLAFLKEKLGDDQLDVIALVGIINEIVAAADHRKPSLQDIAI